MKNPDNFWNPYLAGVALGLVLLAAFLIMGKGLGASGGVSRVATFALDTVAPNHVAETPYMAALTRAGRHLLDSYFVFELFGVFLGGAVSAYAAGRQKRNVIRGPKTSVVRRFAFAITGGAMMGVAARLARGCTSGQALTGGALLSTGSWIFMLSVFAGGYAMAYFVRREWT
jgi:uncharacterized membrane protein YedE/YeeE